MAENKWITGVHFTTISAVFAPTLGRRILDIPRPRNELIMGVDIFVWLQCLLSFYSSRDLSSVKFKLVYGASLLQNSKVITQMWYIPQNFNLDTESRLVWKEFFSLPKTWLFWRSMSVKCQGRIAYWQTSEYVFGSQQMVFEAEGYLQLFLVKSLCFQP